MLFKNTLQLLDFTQLNSETNFAAIKSTIRMVEEQHIIPVLGREAYNYLNDAYQATPIETDLNVANKNLLYQCRLAIAPYVCYYYTPKAEISLSESGARRQETTTSKTAYQYQVTKFREQNLREAEDGIELLLKFLEENKTFYPLWVGSSEFNTYRSLFIKTAKEFQGLFPSHSPYRNYWAMRSAMHDVEEIKIRNVIGDSLFDALKTKDKSSTATFTTKELLLLQKLKKAIAYLTVASALPFLNVRIAANGITIAATSRSENDEVSSRNFASDNALSAIANQSLINGESWIKNALKYLNDSDNAGNFTGWPVVPLNSIIQTNYENERCRVTPLCNRDNSGGGSFGL